ncbi:MAG: metal-dependent transcriptional regulator [Salinivirgaceae bacterium]|nr:metal-dependent transcriptional regulator [Salinivirgaceae bacterium]MDY0280885.1 metal-dependent transcriptional regulator [Salinivirgaceae bacterium]
MTISIDNFVKTIYKQSKLSEADTRISTVAGILNITNSAVTDMARKLALKNMVNYTKYKPLTLTESGNQLALKVIRKHRLWESFLYKTLNLSLHEIHREAEHLEHLTSDFLANEIDKYLGNPSTDPHGDPIPTINGEIEKDVSQILLSEVNAGYTYEISRLSSSDKEFFNFCYSNNISIGAPIWVEKQYGHQKMTEIRIENNKILLNQDFTKFIYVKLLD